MKSRVRSAVTTACLLFSTHVLVSQARYTATRSTRIQAGAGAMYLKSDYVDDGNQGVVVYGDYDFSRWIGLEAEARWGGIISPGKIGENSYLFGPRVTYRRHRITGYGKIMIGRGTITNQITQGASSFNLFAYGGGVEYKLGNKFNLRVIDGEYQKWPDFAPHTLSPVAISIGIAYILH
jgi:hypothetical protein